MRAEHAQQALQRYHHHQRLHQALDAVHQKAEALDGQEQANVYAHEVVPAMDTLRAAVDAMEEIVAADYWPVPTYDDILFYV